MLYLASSHSRTSPIYIKENNNYWSIAARELKPACIAHPTSANDVSAITLVHILNQYTDVRFAVKSGGHSPDVGHAGVGDGVLIALSRLSGAEYDSQKGVAYVKPGDSWQGAFSVLEKDNVAVVGDRIGKDCTTLIN
jgi:nitrogenase subunit NifH